MKNGQLRLLGADDSNIKVSRGEENIFIWCIFLAICELVIDGNEAYKWLSTSIH